MIYTKIIFKILSIWKICILEFILNFYLFWIPYIPRLQSISSDKLKFYTTSEICMCRPWFCIVRLTATCSCFIPKRKTFQSIVTVNKKSNHSTHVLLGPGPLASRYRVSVAPHHPTYGSTTDSRRSSRRHLPSPGDAHAQWGTQYYNNHTSAIWALLYYNDEGKPVVKRFPPTFDHLGWWEDGRTLVGRDDATARITRQQKQTIGCTGRFSEARRVFCNDWGDEEKPTLSLDS